MLKRPVVMNYLQICALALLGTAPFSTAQAALIPISSLLVDNASLNITLTSGGTGTYAFSSPIVPPANIIMGTYQNPIAQFSTMTPTGGTATATIYSAGNGTFPPPPSGYVEGSAIKNVDFSSLRALLSIPLYPIRHPWYLRNQERRQYSGI